MATLTEMDASNRNKDNSALVMSEVEFFGKLAAVKEDGPLFITMHVKASPVQVQRFGMAYDPNVSRAQLEIAYLSSQNHLVSEMKEVQDDEEAALDTELKAFEERVRVGNEETSMRIHDTGDDELIAHVAAGDALVAPKTPPRPANRPLIAPGAPVQNRYPDPPAALRQREHSS